MGGHHGPAVARGDDLVGQTVNIAARISDLAGPGELLRVRRPDRRLPRARRQPPKPLGAAQVKGVEDPIWLYRLTRPV